MSQPQIDPAVNHPDVELHMARESLAGIPQYSLPPGYRLRAYAPGDERVWIDLHLAAEPIIGVTDALFEEQYGDNRAALPERMFFVETAAGVPVASISAWWETRDFADPQNRGRIHWVVVHPDHQRRGLTKPMMTHALLTLAERHDAAMLGTSSSRPWALKVYLDCGFVPDAGDLAQTEVLAAWYSVQEILRHPALADALPADVPSVAASRNGA